MEDLDKRKIEILNIIIKEHIKTSMPVGSSIIVEKYKLGLSPATVRNEMAVLEKCGLIIQPYTSAGRIPTESAYRFFLQNIKKKEIGDDKKKLIDQVLVDDSEISCKNTAKVLAAISGNAVFWAFHKNSLYYTGISNLLQQPEFAQMNLIYNISGIIDKLDEIIIDIFEDLKPGVKILIGEENPFSSYCSVIILKYKKGKKCGLLGILSPIRSDYQKNLSIIDYINKKLIKN
jgi:heat-inducible transcriptional repressor